MSYLVFEIVVNQYVQVFGFLFFSLRNSMLMVKTWVPEKTVPIRGTQNPSIIKSVYLWGKQ